MPAYCPAPSSQLIKPPKTVYFIGDNVFAILTSQIRVLTLRIAGCKQPSQTDTHPQHKIEGITFI